MIIINCEQSPGVYLRDDPLFGTQLQNQSELRVPNAEKAAFYLDAAVNSRSSKEEGRDSHFLYTLHVYQYSVAGKGGVAGGRSRLHLIDLGSCERGKSNGGIPLSGLGNVLLAIFNGQKHLPYREHKITQLLKECLSSLTCHAAMIAHVSQSSQHYTDTLTTVQLASRIHRMRRRKIKFGGPSGPSILSNGGSSDELSRQNASTGSSDFDLSSSEQSADTVIYVAPHDDAATDGEHPPVYMLNLNSVDNRCVLNKAARSAKVEPRPAVVKSKAASPAKSVTSHKTKEEKAVGSPLHKSTKPTVTSSKSSPVRTATAKIPVKSNVETHGKTVSSNAAQPSRHEEHWIDGPRVSKLKVQEARSLLLKESIKKETWIDGPMQKPSKTTGNSQSSGNYGFMDSHKKTMIRKWVENQTVHLKQTLGTPMRSEVTSGLLRSSEPITEESLMCNPCVEFEELNERKVEGSADVVKPERMVEEELKPNVIVGTAVIKQTDACFKELNKTLQEGGGVSCGESSESSEEEKLPPPPLPLILRYGKDINIGNKNQPINALGIQSRMIDDYDDEEDEIELEIVEVTDTDEQVPMQDSCLQVTEEDIAFCMGEGENPLPEVDQESHEEHPLRVLSQENLTVVSTFTDSLSVATDFERCLPRPRYAPPSLFDQPFYPNGPYVYDEYLELLTKNHTSESNTLQQLAKLHELYKSKIGLPNGGATKVSARCQSLSMTDVCDNYTPDCTEMPSGNCSIYSEPAYKLPGDVNSICNSCKKTIPKGDSTEKSLKPQKCTEKVSSGCKLNISSLRHPDGASNPNLEEEDKKDRTSGHGTSKSDHNEENKEKSISKKRMANSEHKRGNSGSPSRKLTSKANTNTKHEGPLSTDKSNESVTTTTTTTTDLLKLNENNMKLINSPTKNTNSLSSRGELRRTNSTSTNKGRRIEDSEDVTKSTTPPPPASSSSPPLTQKHLYFNKTCPSNEGSDSGHESNISPKITKLSGRTRPQAQCESSGYESVVSFTSSLESEVGVKLVCEETEEVHDPGGQSGWWCWCVSGRPSTVHSSMRQSQRRTTASGRTPLTVPPTSARPKP
ncbi:hypothetical protein RUM44_012134 [Polyplax serrata]|uniref:Kinesin motor domain-containing protein n=1 Tax=Polyplax serrata TaxID=468196 RepID=A0ABR1BAF1_POLSC